ncbi:MAG: alcohol dehydrogenase, partial [Rubritepida sp.]|nr:alcohol dehydrogenase [Rubritepida sp.]
VGNLKELRALVGLAQKGGLPAIPLSLEPFANADSALNRLKQGQVTGRVILTAG